MSWPSQSTLSRLEGIAHEEEDVSDPHNIQTSEEEMCLEDIEELLIDDSDEELDDI